jgi:hypothetical protein
VYFWNARALGVELRARRLSGHDKMTYLLPQVVLASSALPPMFWCVEPSLTDAFHAMAVMAINGAGVLACYEANRRGDDADFLDRFVGLSWPLLVQQIALFVAPLLLALWVAMVAFSERWHTLPEWVGSILALILGTTWSAVFYVRLYHHIRAVSEPA